jgi:hypothetical protein
MCIASCLLLLKAFSFLDSDSFSTSTRTFFNEQQKKREKKPPQKYKRETKNQWAIRMGWCGRFGGGYWVEVWRRAENWNSFAEAHQSTTGATANTSGPSRARDSNPFGIPVLCVEDIVHGTKCAARTHRSSLHSMSGNDQRLKKEEVASAAHLSSRRRFHYFTIRREKRRNHVDR